MRNFRLRLVYMFAALLRVPIRISDEWWLGHESREMYNNGLTVPHTVARLRD